MPKSTDSIAPLPVHLLPLAAAIGIYFFLSMVSFIWIDEDAFIGFRIAENIAAGHGYVFNIGGERIELGSSVLWQFLLVPFTFLPWSLVITAKLVGIFFGCISLVVLFYLGLRFLGKPSLAILPVFSTAVSVPFVLWNQGGLETALYGALILVYALALTSDTRFECWWWPVAAIVLARPEGVLLCAAVLPALGSPRRRPSVNRGLLLVLGILLVATAVRVAYFHDFLPHPFYAKFKTDPASGLRGLLNMAEAHHLAFFGLPLVLACFTPRFWTRPTAHLLVLAGILVAWSAYAAEFKPYFRHLAPALPLVSLLLLVGAYHLTSFAGRAQKPLALLYGWAWVVAVALLFTVPLRDAQRESNPLHVWTIQFLEEPTSFTQAVSQKLAHPEARTALDANSPSTRTLGTNYQVGVGQFLAANYPSGISIVYDQMGQTPYYAGADKWFVDSWGLAHRAIGFHGFGDRARRSATLSLYQRAADEALALLYPDEERTVPTHVAIREVFARRPELILTNEYILRSLQNTLPHQIERHPTLEREYRHRYVVEGLVNVYERRDMPRRPLVVPEGVRVENVSDPGSN